jgi:hypothetical protein
MLVVNKATPHAIFVENLPALMGGYFSLKWNGIDTHTSTGPFCIIAGETIALRHRRRLGRRFQKRSSE